MIFGRKRKEQAEQPASDAPPQPPARSLYRRGRSQFEPPESGDTALGVAVLPDFEAAPQATGAPDSEAAPAAPAAVPAAAPEAAPEGDVRPRVILSAARSGPDDFVSRLPLRGSLAGVIPGPDRPDYCLVELDEPIDFEPPEGFDRERIRQSAIDQMVLDLDDVLPITTVVVIARQAGLQVSPTMLDLVVNIAYVLDESVLTDELLDFDKVHFAAVATLNLG